MSADARLDPQPYQRAAIYAYDADCVEYVQEDTFVIYERVDSKLTLIRSDEGIVVGFKLKGFRNIFERLRKSLELSEGLFVPLIMAIQELYTEIGDELVADEHRRSAYQAAYKLAANDNVKLSDVRFAKAA
jgi:hypothetical protein